MAKTNEFQKEVGDFLRRYMGVVVRIDDSAGNRYGGWQVTKRPYDYCGILGRGGIYFAAEAKRVKVPRFAFCLLTEDQRNALLQVTAWLGYAWVFINWRTGRRGGAAIWINYVDYLYIEEQCLNQGRKSIRAEDFPETYHLKRVRGGWEPCKNLEELCIL